MIPMTTILPPKEGLPQSNSERKVYLQELIHMVEVLQETMPFTLLENIITKISDITNPYIAMEILEFEDDTIKRDNNEYGIDKEINNLFSEVDNFSGFKERIEEWKEILQEIEVALPEEDGINEYEKIQGIQAYVGRYSGPHYNIEINILSGKAIWSEGLYTETEYIIPADAGRMSAFLEGIRNCRILKWEKDYNNPYILDGTQWSLTIEIDNRLIKKSGSNSYPKEWEEYCSIIQKLTSKPFK
jgi:hypothetical protein